MKANRTEDHFASANREYPQRPIASAHAIIIKKDRTLLIRRAHEPSKGRWSAPGGVIELGETVYDAVRREVREEYGIEIEVDSVIDVLDGITLDEKGLIRFHYVVIYVLARYVKGEAIPDSDASDVLWVKRNELGRLDMHPLVRKTVELAYETK